VGSWQKKPNNDFLSSVIGSPVGNQKLFIIDNLKEVEARLRYFQSATRSSIPFPSLCGESD
jgi:hypothetical protein